MGICLPLNQVANSWGSRSYQDFEPKGAVVITLENTIISACNSGFLVSKGKFQGFCLRFADDFETTLDDWKPNHNEPIMNVCVVSEGTYEVCSRTTAAKKMENAKWLLNLSSLGHTLTMLTGFEEEETNLESPDSDEGEQATRDTFGRRREFENLPSFVFDPTIDSKKRSVLMEKEMAEQLKIINDLRTLGATHNTIAHEERRLQELQAICYKYFRRDMIQKWRRPSMRCSMRTSQMSILFIGSHRDHIEDGIATNSGRRLDPIASNDEISSLQSTLISGHSRSASLKTNPANRVTFSETMRQTSLPNNADSHDEPQSTNSQEAPTDTPPSEIVIDGTSVEMRRKHQHQQKQQEPNIDFELDIKVLVNSSKCVLHTKETTDDKLFVSSPISSLNI